MRVWLWMFLLATPAHAVFVRGRVTTPLGVPVAYARVQLIQGKRTVGEGISGPDGSYEVRTGLSGRFVLLTSRVALVQIGDPFYGGALDSLTVDVVLVPREIYPAPPASPPVRPFVVRSPELLTEAELVPALRGVPGSFLVQRGPAGSPAELFVQGAGPAATQVRMDEVSAEDLGGRFNLATLGASGLAGTAVAPAVLLTAAPGLPDAQAATLALRMPQAETLHPNLVYTGDAGNQAALRNEALATLAYRRVDLLGSFARYDTANGDGGSAVPFHLATAAANVGYHLSAGTSLRGTLRRDVAASALAPFFGIARSGKDASQDLYVTGEFDTVTSRAWRNTVRYGLVRRREQAYLFAPVLAQSLTLNGATAQVKLPGAPGREDRVTDRDEATYQTNYPVREWLHAGLLLRYQNERGVDLAASSQPGSQPGSQLGSQLGLQVSYREALTRTHFTAVPALSGQVRHRLFYTAGATLDRSPVYGFNAAPNLGITYAPVRPGTRRFRGSVLRASAATGFREPSALEALQPGTPRSRVFLLAEDQQIVSKLMVTTTYFHRQFSHDYELRRQAGAAQQAVLTPTLAYRTQGVTLELRYHPLPRVRLGGAYTYLASLTEQAAGTDGLLNAKVGARPFDRPAHTGQAMAQYTGPRLTASFLAAFAGRSDGSTMLAGLVLPNRDLSPGWVSLDANAALVLTPRVTVFTQLTNLAGSRTMAPVGFASAPLLVRTGLRIRFGAE